MSFVLLRSNVFIKNARKIVKKQPALAPNIQDTLELLQIDPFEPRLRLKILQTLRLRAQLEASSRPNSVLDKLVQIGQNSVSVVAIAGLLVSLHWGIIAVYLRTSKMFLKNT